MTMQVLQVLLEITTYSAILFACIMVFKTIARGKLSPTLSFVLWFLLIIRLCVPFTIQSAYHLITLPQEQQQAVATAAPASSLPQDIAIPEQNDSIQYMPVQQETPQIVSDESTQLQPVQALPPLTVYDWIVIAWIGGICVFGAWATGLSMRIVKVIRHQSVPAPAEIEKIYEVCRREMRIRKRPPLLVTQNLQSPALVVSARPTILLPYAFVKQAPPEQIKLALCHELAHYKRKDHILCMLLRVLSVVYWFNPVLWLAEKEIAADMETACDNRIVRGMQKEEKAYYANTILSMFSARAETPFILGLALPNTKRVAEKRIRGIYMKNKTKKGVKFAALLLAAVLFTACFTTACQPVQAQESTTPPAASNNAQAAPAIASATPVSVQPSLPAASAENKYKKTDKLNDIVTVNYNADMVQPEKVPQASLKIRDFTEADVQKVADYFFAGRPSYSPWTRTKSQLQAEIDKLQQQNKEIIAERDAFLAANAWAEILYKDLGQVSGMNSDAWDQVKDKYSLTNDDEETYGTIVASVKDTTGMNSYWIKKDQEELKTAQDTEVKKPAVLKFQDVDTGNVAGVEGGVETKSDHDYILNTKKLWTEAADGTISEVAGFRMDKGANSRITYSREISLDNSSFFPSTFPPLTIQKEQAQKLAQDAVQSICPELILADSTVQQQATGRDGPYVDRFYAFAFQRSVADIPITYSAYGSYGYTDDKDKTTGYELISVLVDDKGIFSLEWRTPYTNIQVTNPDAKVIPMEEAIQKFESYTLASLKGVPNEGPTPFWSLSTITLNISKIQLGLTRVIDKSGNYILVPTWDFFGTAQATRNGEEQIFNRFGQKIDDASLGTVNALDGSEIKRGGAGDHW